MKSLNVKFQIDDDQVKILVVDDESFNLKAITYQLNKIFDNIEIITASNG